MNGSRGCVGTGIDLYGSWGFLPILFRLLIGNYADSEMCVALLVPEMNTRSGAKSH